ncbi:MAG TPA: oxygenase MpaB family protein [Xanthobacteraceae bacterium]|nr:oxygenase MpaB family protein [Xanthobacteraceae bacterium]
MRTAADSSFTETFERQLQRLQTAGGATEGLFGPASLTWRVDREAIAFLGAGRALLLQLAHPWVAIAIAEHSRAGIDPIGRFHRTFAVVYTMVFGSRTQAFAAARALHARHAAITGTMPADFGPFARGSYYCANELDALRWVYATLIDTAVLAQDMVLTPLTDGERDAYYTESKRFAALFGIAPEELPDNWTGFAAYNAAMWRSDILTVTPAARDIARQLMSAPRTVLRAPRWYRAVTAAMLPPSLRTPFDLPFGEAERRVAKRAVARIRKLYPRLPARLRYVAPYHEAMARLAGRQPDPVTRLLNRVWIGRPIMADKP